GRSLRNSRAAQRPQSHSYGRPGGRGGPQSGGRGGGPSVSAPCTVADALAAAADSDRGIRTIEHDGQTLLVSYKTLLAEAPGLAAALGGRGGAGAYRVASVEREVSEFIRLFFGISAAGLVPVPLCPPAQAGDVATFVRQSDHVLTAGRARVVVASAGVQT